MGSMMQVNPVLLTKEAIKNKWHDTRWFGAEYPYIPFVDMEEYALGEGQIMEDGSVFLEVFESFEFLTVYRYGEFLASFELPFITYSGQIIDIKNFSLEVTV